MPSEGDVVFAQLLSVHHLATDKDIREGLAACDRIADLGVVVNLAEILVARGVIDVARANEIARIQLKKTQIGLLRTQLATLRLTREEDKRIGNMAAHNGLVSQEQLDDALRIQEELRKEKIEKPLGVIMSDKAYLAPEVVQSLLELQAQLKSGPHPDVPMILAHEDLTFCAVAVEQGRITHDRAQQAIATQRRIFEKLRMRQPMTEVVYGLRMMTLDSIQAVSEVVTDRRKGVRPPPVSVLELSPEQDTRLGSILVERGQVTPQQVGTCVDVQKRLRGLGIDRRLGEVMIMLGFATREDLLAGMAAQRQRRAGGGPAAPVPEANAPAPAGLSESAIAAGDAVLEDEPVPPLPPSRPAPALRLDRPAAAVASPPPAPVTREREARDSEESVVEAQPIPDAPAAARATGTRRRERGAEREEDLPSPPRLRPPSGVRAALGARASSGLRRPVPVPARDPARIALLLAGTGVLMAVAGLVGYLASKAVRRGDPGHPPSNTIVILPTPGNTPVPPANETNGGGTGLEDPAARRAREVEAGIARARELSGAGDPEQALRVLDALRRDPAPMPTALHKIVEKLREPLRDRIAEDLFVRAQESRAKGEKAEAAALFQRIIDEFAGTLSEDAARKELEALGE